MEIFPDGLHGNIFFGDLVLINQDFADTRIIPAVGGGKMDGPEAAVGKSDQSGSLNLEEVNVDRILKVDQFVPGQKILVLYLSPGPKRDKRPLCIETTDGRDSFLRIVLHQQRYGLFIQGIEKGRGFL
jgi:hypothetical protein